MSGFTNAVENGIINAILRASPLVYTSVFVGLLTQAPTDAGSGQEPSDSGYSRMPITFGPPANGEASNDSDITFPRSVSQGYTVTHLAIYNQAAGGTMLWYGALDSNVAIAVGDNFYLATGGLTARVT